MGRREVARKRVLSAAGLQPTQLADPEELLDLECVLRLFQAAAEESKDDCLGLHMGERWDLGDLGVLSYAVLNASTVGTALRNLDRYSRSHLQGGAIRFTADARKARLAYELSVPDRELARQHVEASAVVGVRILRRLLGEDWHPSRVRFAHGRPRSVSEHERILRCPVSFGGGTTEIEFDARVLEDPVPGADRRLLPLVERHLEEVVARRGDDAWLLGVRNAVAESLCDGNPTIRNIAKQMGTSVRTLQRRLEAQGVVFKDLAVEIRRDLAHRYLAEDKASLTEIAFLLGYSELSAFDRAFRSWTGSTPLAMRRSLHAS